MASATDLLNALTQQMIQNQGGPPPPVTTDQPGHVYRPPTIGELKALRTGGLGNDYAGVNAGGRHDPRMGSVLGGGAGDRLVLPPSRGRTMSAKQTSTDADALNMVHDAMGGTDLSGLRGQDPKVLLQNGLQAIASVGNGQRTPEAIKAARDFVSAVQGGIIPSTPEVNKLIDAMKSAKLLNQSNIPTF